MKGRQMRRRVLLWFIIAIGAASAAVAQGNKPSAVAEIITFASKPQSDYTAEYRAKFAQAVANFCQGVLDALPTNTPAEDAWVASEGKTKNPTKFIRLLNSKEYNRHFLKTTFSDCKDTAGKTVEMVQQLKRTGKVSSLEASQLIKLAQLFDGSIGSYSANIEMDKSAKEAIDDLHLSLFGAGY